MKKLEELIKEAKGLIEYSLRSDSADHLRGDYREAWAFVRKVSGIVLLEPEEEPKIAAIAKGESKCKGCGAKIKWIRTESGASMPLNAKPGRYYRKARTTPLNYFSEEGYQPHFVSCPDAKKFRRKKNETA